MPLRHRDHGRQNLSGKLDGELPVVEIVQECDDGDRHRRLDDADEVRIGQPGEFGEAVKHRDADQECHHHADPAALWRIPRVHLAWVRPIHHAHRDHHAHHGGGQQRQPGGKGQMAQNGDKSHAGSSRRRSPITAISG